MRSSSSAGDRRAFHKALLNGDVAAVRTMLDDGMPAESAHGGVTALVLASLSLRSVLLVQMLLAAGAAPNRRLVGRASDYGHYRTALLAAAGRGHLRTVELLLDSGADPTALDDRRCSAAHLLVNHVREAEKAGNLDMFFGLLRRMVELGVQINARQDGGHALIHTAARKMRGQELERLCELGADPFLPTDLGTTPFEFACETDNPTAVEFFLDRGADPRTIMLHRVEDPVTLDILIAAGANLENKDARGRTALHASVAGWKYSCYPDEPLPPWKALRLVAAGASLDAEDNEGNTPRAIVEKHEIAEVAALAAVLKASQVAREAMQKLIRNRSPEQSVSGSDNAEQNP